MEITKNRFPTTSLLRSKKPLGQIFEQSSIQNLIHKKYSVSLQQRSLQKMKYKEQASLRLRATSYNKGRTQRTHLQIPLQFFPKHKHYKDQIFQKLQYEEEAPSYSEIIRERYTRQRISEERKKIIKKYDKNPLKSVDSTRKQLLFEEKNEKPKQVQNSFTNEQEVQQLASNLITYYRQKYDKHVQPLEINEKRQKVNLLLKQVSQNRPKIKFRSYEVRRKEPKKKKNVKEEEQFSGIDPW